MARRGPHPTELGLLDAIHAHPRDGAPRLIYADWLEEHEDPARAEFIRLSVAWEKQHLGLWIDTSCQCGGDEERVRQLALANRSKWLRPIRKRLIRAHAVYGPFVGGLPLPTVSVHCSLEWKGVLDEVMKWIDERSQIHLWLPIPPQPSSLLPLLPDTFTGRVAQLSVFGPGTREQPPEAVGWESMRRVPLSAEQATSLANWPRLGVLRELTLSALSPEAQEIVQREIVHRVPTKVIGAKLG